MSYPLALGHLASYIQGMDPATHILSGAALAMAAPGRPKSRLFVAFGALCGTAPDIDVIFGSTPEAVMTLHRGLSHSIFFAPLFALGLSFLAIKLTRGRIGWSIPKLTILATLALWMHTLLDCFTSFGTMALLPFSAERVFIPALYIVDPVYTLVLAGLLAFALIKGCKERKRAPAANIGTNFGANIRANIGASSRESITTGQPQRSLAKRGFAVAAVCWLAVWPLLNLSVHQIVESRIQRAAALPGQPIYHVLPEAFSPLYWKVVAQTDDAYYQGLYSLGSAGQVVWNTAESEGLLDCPGVSAAAGAPLPYPRPSAERLARLAGESELFRTYNDFAMFIIEETGAWPSARAARDDLELAAREGVVDGLQPLLPEQGDTLLVLRDLRLDSVQPLAGALRNSVRVFQAVALLDASGELKSESFIGNAGSTPFWRVYPEGHGVF